MDKKGIVALSYKGTELKRFENGLEIWPGDALICCVFEPMAPGDPWHVSVAYGTSREVSCVYGNESALWKDWSLLYA